MAKSPPPALMVEIAPGELLDKLTILTIKRRKIADPAKLANIEREYALLAAVRDEHVPNSAQLTRLVEDLATINAELWRIEDDIRLCEARQDFGEQFIALARSVYKTNDRRSVAKRAINDLLGARIIEEKSYAG